MSIDFPCSSCRQTVRVPDGTEGKKTKCPKCQEVQVIPDKNSFGSSSAPAPKPTPPPAEQPKKEESIWDGLGAESQPSPPPSSNPFGDQPDQPDPFGPPADNPYLSPTQSSSSSYSSRPVSRAEARNKLMGPAIGVLATTVLGLISQVFFMVAILADISNDADLNDGEDLFALIIVMLFMFGLPILLSVFCIGTMARAFYVKSYGLVMAGFIVAMTPFSGGCTCLITIWFAIWGLVVMNDDSVKAAFRQP